MSFKVNKRLFPMKGHYFFFNAGTAPVVPFMPTLARQLGFSSTVVGIIYTILPVVGLLCKPLFGAIADKYQKRKILFLAFQLLTAIAFFGIKFIQPIAQTTEMNFHCNNAVSSLKFCLPSGSKLDQQCLVGPLIANENDSTLFNCHLTCQLTEQWMAEEICTHWQQSKNCIVNRSEINLIVNIPLNKIEPANINECLLFEIKSGYLADDEQNSKISCPDRKNNETLDFKSQCVGRCSNEHVMQVISSQAVENNNVLGLHEFWLFFWLLAISWAGMAVVVSLGDAICFQLLGEHHNLYGHQRLWGAVGWGIFSLLAGLLVDEMSRGSLLKDYSGVFYMMLFFIGFDILFSLKIDDKQATHSSQLLKDVGLLFKSPKILIFFCWCIVIGLCTALIWNFLFWHLELLADADLEKCGQNTWMKTLQGLAMGIQCFGGELPFFFISGWVLNKIGHIHAMSLVLFGFSVRFFLYSILTNPWWVLPIELMQGVTFGIFYSTMASYASLVAPPGTEATLQGLVGAIFEGIGVSAGSFIGGYLIDNIGGSATFRAFGVFALIFFVIHVLLQLLVERFYTNRDYRSTLRYITPGDALSMLDDNDHMPSGGNNSVY